MSKKMFSVKKLVMSGLLLALAFLLPFLTGQIPQVGSMLLPMHLPVLVCGFAAGASAGGLARWYMSAAVLLGAVSWRWAVQPAVHRAAAALAELACRPLRLVHKMLVRPAQMRLQAAQSRRRACRKAKKSAKIKKSAEKRLQKPSKVLYN